jgi:2-polyprenyl-3-methyl-5-hydroxy-6-metoxy-1,4-benzoquinol methylase
MPFKFCLSCHTARVRRVELRAKLAYWICQDCGHCEIADFDKNLTEAFNDAQQNYFGDVHSLTFGEQNPFEKEALKKRYSVIERNLHRSGKALEVGPGAGHIIKWLAHHGHDVTAVEHSPVFSKFLLDTLSANILTGEFESAELQPDTFDSFFSFHVIEHVPDPLLHLAKAYEVTKPGGVAFIATPNARSLQQIAFESLSPNFDSAHLRVFSPRSLQNFCEQAGWSVISKTTPEYSSSWLRVVTKAFRRLKKENEETTAGKYAQRVSSKFNLPASMIVAGSFPLRTLQSALGFGNEIFFVLKK